METWRDIFTKYDPDITNEEIDAFLWEQTCYPFDNERTIEQIEEYYKTINNEK